LTPRTRNVLWIVIAGLFAAVLFWAYQKYVLGAGVSAFKWMREGKTYELLEPKTLGLILIAPIILYVIGKSLADLPWQQRIFAFLFRVAFIVLIALGLARLARTAETSKVATVFVVDVSDSVEDPSLEEAQKTLQAAIDARGKEDVVKLIAFAKRPRLIEMKEENGTPVVPDLNELRNGTFEALKKLGIDKPGAGSDIQSAMQLGYGVFPPGYLKRLVVVTDGVETSGDVLAEANRARGFDVKVFAVPYRRPPPGEVALRNVHVPEKVDIGQPFDVTANVYSSRKTTAKARLYQGEALNGLDGVKDIELKAGENEVKFKSIVRVGGTVTYALKLDSIKQDKFAENNQYAVTVDVPGRPTVLYVEGQPHRASYLTSALSAQQFDVDVRAANAFPGSLKELERYDFVVVSDVPKEALSIAAQDLIERYVRDLGGGFLFAGGEAGYGLGGWAHTTIERILPVRMDSQRRKDMPSVAMALVIDRSGSMTGLPMEMAKEACKATVSTLEGEDLVEVIAFDTTPIRYVKFQPARYRSRIQNEIARIQPGGGTEIFPGLDMAYQDISVVQARKKHVILLTDGRAPTQGLKDLVQAMIAESITLTTVGLGEGADHELLRMLADTGGGRYHQVPDPNALPKIFTRETEMIARQAAVEEWFPVQVITHADFLKGIAVESAPLLHGYVATQMKEPPAQLILASDRGEPILARMRLGLGHTLAWTSDVKNLWAVDWLRWSGFSKFWGQLVREHMRSKHRRELDMKTEVIGDRVHAVVDAFTVDERFDNEIESKLSITGPEPNGERKTIPMRQTAPGRYEADFQLEKYGSFLLKAEHIKTDKKGQSQSVGVSYGHVSNPYPREYASFEPDVDRLSRAALAGGGKLDPPPKDLFDPQGEKIVYYEQLWSRFILAAIVVFLLDLLIRRVRFFDRKFVPKKRKAA
jgi:uncharacterized membrane protein